MDTKMTITLSQDEIQKILKEYLLEKRFMRVIGNVHFDVGTRLEGYGMGEHEAAYFGGVSCEVKFDQQAKNDAWLRDTYPDHSSNQQP